MIFQSTWGAPYEPEIFMASFKTPSHSAGYSAQKGLKQKALIDDKLTKMTYTTDDKEKSKLIKEVLTILHDEAVYIPIVYNTNKGVASSKIKGIKGSIIEYQVVFDDIEKVTFTKEK